jgi:hypothetical protein
MERLARALLLLAVLFLKACGSGVADSPPLDDEATREAIAEEDAAIDAAESQQ